MVLPSLTEHISVEFELGAPHSGKYFKVQYNSVLESSHFSAFKIVRTNDPSEKSTITHQYLLICVWHSFAAEETLNSISCMPKSGKNSEIPNTSEIFFLGSSTNTFCFHDSDSIVKNSQKSWKKFANLYTKKRTKFYWSRYLKHLLGFTFEAVKWKQIWDVSDVCGWGWFSIF